MAVTLRNSAAAALLGLTVACVGTTSKDSATTDTGETEPTRTTGSTSADYGASYITETAEDTGSVQSDYGVPSTYTGTGDTGSTN